MRRLRSTGILIMSRAPRAGEVKTRLEPMLGPDGCARLQAALIRHTAAWVAAVSRRAWLAHTPAASMSAIVELAHPAIRLLPQEGPDLGARLVSATGHVFASHRHALAVIGTDAPELGPVHLHEVEAALQAGYPVCLIPAVDGGYALIALSAPTPQAFALPADAWGGPDVLELTLRALRRTGCPTAVLEPVRDLDTPDDALSIAADPRCPEPIRQILRPAVRA